MVQPRQIPIQTFNSIAELHAALGFSAPAHPYISLTNETRIQADRRSLSNQITLDFYKISIKMDLEGRVRYGQDHYDLTTGDMVFIAPRQVISIIKDRINHAGYVLYLHPDFIRKYPLARTIVNFGYFSYAANEALKLSDSEKEIILSIFLRLEQELSLSPGEFSQDVIISYLELLLNYSNRFYKRQFSIDNIRTSHLVEKLETILMQYFNDQEKAKTGLPTVQHLAEQVAVSPRYLTDMLRSVTGKSTKQFIDEKLIDKSKEILSSSTLSVAEVAFRLGFEHPQSFHKFFKNKTNLSPLSYRRSFN